MPTHRTDGPPRLDPPSRSPEKPRGGFAHFLMRFCTGGALPPLALAMVIFAITAPGLALLRSDFSHRGFFFADDARLVDYERFEERFGNDDTVVLGVEVRGGVLDEEAWERVAAIAMEVSEIPGVVTVEAATNHAKGVVLANRVPEALVGTLVSADGTLALIVGSLAGEPDAKSVTRALEAIVARQDERTTVHLTGTPVITAAFETVAANDLGRLVPIAVAVMILVLLLLLRSFVVAFAALVAIALGAISAMGVAGLIGAPINNLTLAVPQILVAIGTAGCVHLLSAYRDARRDGRDTAGAMRHSLTLNARPMLLASGTTAVGFFSLAISDLKPVATLGLVAGSGTLLIVV